MVFAGTPVDRTLRPGWGNAWTDLRSLYAP
jgi:hypothetical protein